MTRVTGVRSVILMMGVSLCLGGMTSVMAETSERDKVRTVIETYVQALNADDVETIVGLYTANGVFMPAGKPTAVGSAQIEQAYKNVFKALDLEVAFHFDEIVLSGPIAYVRTASDGQIKLLDNNTAIDNNSRELFIMEKSQGQWRIARYMFNEASSQPH